MAQKDPQRLLPDNKRAELYCISPRPNDPPNYFAMAWLHRELAIMTAAANRDPIPTFPPMPAWPRDKL